MHVLLVPMGSHGDVHPLVGVGRALKDRGHRVTLITAAPFRDLAAKNGFDDFAEVGTVADFEAVMHDPDAWHPSRSLGVLFGSELYGQLLRRGYQQVADRYVRGETVVVAGTLALGARLAHDALGVPLATVHLQPLSLQSAAEPPAYPQWPGARHVPGWFARLAYWWADWYKLDPLIGGPLNRLRAELGLPPVKRVWGKWRHSPQRVIGLFPDWFGSAPDWPPQTRLTGFVRYDQGEAKELPPGVRQFLDAGEPPVVVSFGSAMRVGRPYFAAAVEACRRLGRRGLILAKGGDQIPPDLPPGVAQFDYAPFSLVFPRAAAAVHHGGIGTSAQGLAAGVPQLVMPLAFDQYDNALRLQRLGAARVLPAGRFTADRATAELRKLLADPAVPAACERAAAKLRAADPLPETCRLIEELV